MCNSYLTKNGAYMQIFGAIFVQSELVVNLIFQLSKSINMAST